MLKKEGARHALLALVMSMKDAIIDTLDQELRDAILRGALCN